MRQTLDLESEQVQTPDGLIVPVHSGIRVNIYSPRANEDVPADLISTSPLPRTFHYGDRIRFLAKLRPPRNFRNPGAFDYEGYLADRGIAALGSAKIENVESLTGFAGSRIERLRNRMHASVIAKVHQLWPPREAALIDAMIIGEEAFIDRDTRVDFQRSGTYHILVVSGMNVSILAFVVFWTLRRLHVGDVPATLLTVASRAGFAFITEVGAPVWRATLMCGVYLGTRLLYRDGAMTNALGGWVRTARLRSPATLLRQLPDDILMRADRCSYWHPDAGGRTSQLYPQALANWDSKDYAVLLPPRVAQFRLDLQIILRGSVVCRKYLGGKVGS